MGHPAEALGNLACHLPKRVTRLAQSVSFVDLGLWLAPQSAAYAAGETTEAIT